MPSKYSVPRLSIGGPLVPISPKLRFSIAASTAADKHKSFGWFDGHARVRHPQIAASALPGFVKGAVSIWNACAPVAVFPGANSPPEQSSG